MEAREAVLVLEKELKKRLIIERIIECAVVVLFLALGISCYALREASREVITHQIVGCTYETVSYNFVNNYLPFYIKIKEIGGN